MIQNVLRQQRRIALPHHQRVGEVDDGIIAVHGDPDIVIVQNARRGAGVVVVEIREVQCERIPARHFEADELDRIALPEVLDDVVAEPVKANLIEVVDKHVIRLIGTDQRVIAFPAFELVDASIEPGLGRFRLVGEGIDRIVTRPAAQVVTAARALDHVVSDAAEDGVVPVAAIEHVIAGRVSDRVGFVSTKDGVIAAAAFDGVFAITPVQRVMVGSTVDVVVAVTAEDRVVAGAPEEVVPAVLARQNVITGIAEDVVIAGAAGQNIIAAAAFDRIRAGAAADLVGVFSAIEFVIAAAALDEIAPVVAMDLVVIVADAACQDVVARAAKEHITV